MTWRSDRRGLRPRVRAGLRRSRRHRPRHSLRREGAPSRGRRDVRVLRGRRGALLPGAHGAIPWRRGGRVVRTPCGLRPRAARRAPASRVGCRSGCPHGAVVGAGVPPGWALHVGRDGCGGRCTAGRSTGGKPVNVIALTDLATATPETLTHEGATVVWEALRARCQTAHEVSIRRRSFQTRAFCVCGCPSGGPVGTEACSILRELSEGGDGAQWIDRARWRRSPHCTGAATPRARSRCADARTRGRCDSRCPVLGLPPQSAGVLGGSWRRSKYSPGTRGFREVFAPLHPGVARVGKPWIFQVQTGMHGDGGRGWPREGFPGPQKLAETHRVGEFLRTRETLPETPQETPRLRRRRPTVGHSLNLGCSCCNYLRSVVRSRACCNSTGLLSSHGVRTVCRNLIPRPIMSPRGDTAPARALGASRPPSASRAPERTAPGQSRPASHTRKSPP